MALTLVCFAVKQEARSFLRLAAAHSQLHTLVTGMGQRNAERAVRDRLAALKPQLVLTCGLAGGLDPALATGTVLFAAEANPALRDALLAAGARPARFHCAGQVASTAAQKLALRQATGADAVEMESQAICSVCKEQGIPCATVRVILDPAGEDLPLDFNQLLTADQQLDPRKLALAILRSPGKIAALIHLQKQTRSAAQKLAACLIKVLA